MLRTNVKPRRLVKLIQINHQPWPFMIDLFNKTIEHYHANAYHDGTGVRNVVNDYIDHSDTLHKFVMIGQPRTELLLDYITAFEHSEYELPIIDKDPLHQSVVANPLYQAHRAVTVANIYAPKKWNSHLPDEAAAITLAHQAAEKLPHPTPNVFQIRKTNAPRSVDAPFHTEPDGSEIVVQGEVTIQDERYSSGDYVVAEAGDPWGAFLA